MKKHVSHKASMAALVVALGVIAQTIVIPQMQAIQVAADLLAK